VTAVVVWQTDPRANGGFRSQWVERIDDKPKVIAERPGVIGVAESSLWTLGSSIVKGCSQYAREEGGNIVVQNGQPVYVRPDMDMPELVRASDGLRVAPWKDGHGYPTVGTQCPSTLEDYNVGVTLVGGMGPFVIASVHFYINAGGAHGYRGQNFVTLDLEQGAEVKLFAPEADREALAKAAAKGLEVEAKEVNASGVVLLYGPTGKGLALYQFWASAPYVSGMGASSYSNDFAVSSKSLPIEILPHQSLPGWVVPFLGGKSLHVFMVAPGQTPALKKQFEAAYSTGSGARKP
jgi:hypothetical protein